MGFYVGFNTASVSLKLAHGICLLLVFSPRLLMTTFTGS